MSDAATPYDNRIEGGTNQWLRKGYLRCIELQRGGTPEQVRALVATARRINRDIYAIGAAAHGRMADMDALEAALEPFGRDDKEDT